MLEEMENEEEANQAFMDYNKDSKNLKDVNGQESDS